MGLVYIFAQPERCMISMPDQSLDSSIEKLTGLSLWETMDFICVSWVEDIWGHMDITNEQPN